MIFLALLPPPDFFVGKCTSNAPQISLARCARRKKGTKRGKEWEIGKKREEMAKKFSNFALFLSQFLKSMYLCSFILFLLLRSRREKWFLVAQNAGQSETGNENSNILSLYVRCHLQRIEREKKSC